MTRIGQITNNQQTQTHSPIPSSIVSRPSASSTLAGAATSLPKLAPQQSPKPQGTTAAAARSQQGILSTIRNGAAFGADLRKRDQAQGYGVIEGVRSMPDRMRRADRASQIASAIAPALTTSVLTGDTSSLEAVGSAAQQWQLQQLQNQAITWGLSQLGFDTASLSQSQLGSLALEYLGVTPSATAQASTGLSAGAETAGAATAAGSELATANQIAGAAAALYSGYQMIDSWGESNWKAGAAQGASMGAYVGSFVGPWGTAIGAVVGGVAGAIAGSIKSGKHQDQKMRDAGRDFLQSRGMIDQQYAITLADGSAFDIGVDGGHTFENLDGTTRAAYEIDQSNPMTEQAIAWIDPLSEVLMGGNEKLRSDFTGYFVNATTHNAQSFEQVYANTLALYQQAGISPQALFESVVQLADTGTIDPERAQVYLMNMQALLGAGTQEAVMQ